MKGCWDQDGSRHPDFFVLEGKYEEFIEKIGKVDYPYHCNASYVYSVKVCIPDRLCAERVHGADAEKGQLYHRLPDIFQYGDRRYHYIPA